MTTQEIISTILKGSKIENIIVHTNLVLDFSKNQYFHDEIEFVNCQFHDGFSFLNLISSDTIVRFKECKFSKKRSFFNNIELKFIEFDNCSFYQMQIKNYKGSDLYFNECISTQIYLLDNKLDHVEVINNRIKYNGLIRIDSPEINEILIEADSCIDNLIVGAINRAYIKGNFDRILLDIKTFEKIEIHNKNSNVEKLQFQDCSFDGNLTIQNVFIKRLKFENLICGSGSIKLNEVSLENAQFNDCSISNLYWNQVKFINAPEIIRCDFSNLKMSNLIWKGGKRLKNSFLDKDLPWLYVLRVENLKKRGLNYSDEDVSNLKYQRDTYRQLKAAALANHNQIDAFIFYKNEMNLYWKQVRIEGGERWYDRILIFLSRWVSNFGQNWVMPLIWLFVFHTLFMLCIFYGKYWIVGETIKYGFAGEYFQMLNPIHKLPDYVNTDAGKVADFFMRLFGGYFIYHFIKASRKFIEK